MFEVLQRNTQQDFTEKKREVIRPKSKFNHRMAENGQHYQIEMKDKHGKTWRADQAKGSTCSGSISLRTGHVRQAIGPLSYVVDGYIKRSYSCSDGTTGNIQTGFSLFDQPICISTVISLKCDSKIPNAETHIWRTIWSI